jgi:hypothetical protein
MRCERARYPAPACRRAIASEPADGVPVRVVDGWTASSIGRRGAWAQLKSLLSLASQFFPRATVFHTIVTTLCDGVRAPA